MSAFCWPGLPAALMLAISANGAGEVQITLEEAIRQTLANNFEIAQEKLGLKSALEDAAVAESEFDPALDASVSAAQSRNPGASAFSDPEITRSGSEEVQAGLTGKISTGAQYKVGVAARRSDTNSTFQSLDPVYESAVSLEAAQPLLKDAGKEVNLWKVAAGKAGETLAEYRLKAKISDAVTSLVTAYWELSYAAENLKAQKSLLEWAREMEVKIAKQVRAGAVAPIEIVQAQASAASAEEQVVTARNVMARRADILLALMNPPPDSPLWTAEVIPAPLPAEIHANPEGNAGYPAIALEKRPELAMARAEIESKSAELVYLANQTLPALDVTASVRLNGLRGSAQPVLDMATGETRVSQLDGGFGESLGDSVSGDYYDYTLGIRFSYPLGGRGATGRRAKSNFELEAAALRLKKMERDVANEARDAAREVVSGLQRIQAAAAARILAEKRLEAEMIKFEKGSSNSFNVLQYQQDLASQQAREARAKTDCLTAKAMLARAIGETFAANGVSLEKVLR